MKLDPAVAKAGDITLRCAKIGPGLGLGLRLGSGSIEENLRRARYRANTVG